MQRTADAVWHGSGKEGSGTLDTQSGVLRSHPYSFRTRFEDEEGRAGTNPEELIGAAHAGCFTMQLSFMLDAAGFTATELRTHAAVTLGPVDGKQTISRIALSVEGSVPSISDADFQRIAGEAKASCPVSRVLNAEITLDAKLV
ncbi:MAG TPA: OsmC family protein [Gemmatimonas sp.]|nr:OsmC family protein [Gemmatimonas sp.]